MIKGLIGAVLGGAVGAMIWAAIAYFTHYEIGWIAWGVGGLVGFGMMMGAQDSSGAHTGAVAAIIALASICAGKYVAIHFMVKDDVHELRQSLPPVTDDDAQIMLADQLVKEYEEAGKKLKWPEGMTVDAAEKAEDYPKDLWKDMLKRWEGMTAEHQQQYRDTITRDRDALVQAVVGAAEEEGFLGSFGLFDALFGFLAVATAFKLGSGGGDE